MLQPHLKPIRDLRADPDNARLHPTRNLEAIRTSLQTNGQVLPVLERDGMLVSGNGTMAVAQRLGWTHLAAMSLSDLTVARARALSIMLNRSAEQAEWDFPRLALAFEALPRDLVELVGFTSEERHQAYKRRTVQMVTIKATLDQSEVIKRAIERVRTMESDGTISDGRALELICADFLGGA